MYTRKISPNQIINYILLLIISYHAPLFASSSPETRAAATSFPPQTYRLTTLATIRDKPDGKIVAVWQQETRFTSIEQHEKWIKVSGTFPDNRWMQQSESLWINRSYTASFTPRQDAIPSGRPKNISRRITVDKSDFMLTVFERKEGSATEEVIYTTQVALGMDRCLPKEQGGKCYYTDPGEYQIRWKIHDPDGIEWCIPQSMEDEYRSDIEAGNRCFRGALGNYALNIGMSYAIHGTANTASIGTRASHGCVRTANADIERIFGMMDVGDPVYIVE